MESQYAMMCVRAVDSATPSWICSNPNPCSQADSHTYPARRHSDGIPHADAGQQDAGRRPSAEG